MGEKYQPVEITAVCYICEKKVTLPTARALVDETGWIFADGKAFCCRACEQSRFETAPAYLETSELAG